METRSADSTRNIERTWGRLFQYLGAHGKQYEDINQHLVRVGDQSRRTGASVAAGAETGAIGLKNLAAAGLAAYGAVKSVQEAYRAVTGTVAQTAELGRQAARAGTTPQRLYTLEAAVERTTNVAPEQTGAEIENLRRGVNAIITGSADAYLRAGMAGIDVGTSEAPRAIEAILKDLQKKLMGMRPDQAAYLAGYLGMAGIGQYLRQGPEVTAEAERRAETRKPSPVDVLELQRLQGTENELRQSTDALWRTITSDLSAAGLRSALDGLKNFADDLRTDQGRLREVEIGVTAVSAVVGITAVSAIAKLLVAVNGFWAAPAVRGLVSLVSLFGGTAAFAGFLAGMHPAPTGTEREKQIDDLFKRENEARRADNVAEADRLKAERGRLIVTAPEQEKGAFPYGAAGFGHASPAAPTAPSMPAPPAQSDRQKASTDQPTVWQKLWERLWPSAPEPGHAYRPPWERSSSDVPSALSPSPANKISYEEGAEDELVGPRRTLPVLRGPDRADDGSILGAIWAALRAWLSGTQFRPRVSISDPDRLLRSDSAAQPQPDQSLTGEALMQRLDQRPGSWDTEPNLRTWGTSVPIIGEIPRGGPASPSDPRGMAGVIKEAAVKYGVDSDVALRVARSEGLGRFSGDRGTSYGAFQLHVGGGLGDIFRRETGLDPSDPKNETATIDWAIRNLRKTGWSPYHGARNVGVSNWQGIDREAPTVATAPFGARTSDSGRLDVAYGDSLAAGLVRHAGIPGTEAPFKGGENLPGTTRVGAPTAEVLRRIRDALVADPDAVRGKNVLLSTGASNSPGDLGPIADQIAALKGSGAASVEALGLGPRPDLKAIEPRLREIVEKAGGRFVPLDPRFFGRDQVHPTRDWRGAARAAQEAVPHQEARSMAPMTDHSAFLPASMPFDTTNAITPRTPVQRDWKEEYDRPRGPQDYGPGSPYGERPPVPVAGTGAGPRAQPGAAPVDFSYAATMARQLMMIRENTARAAAAGSTTVTHHHEGDKTIGDIHVTPPPGGSPQAYGDAVRRSARNALVTQFNTGLT